MKRKVRGTLLHKYNLEIGSGLGHRDKVWRIGLMGHSSHEEKVDFLLDCLKKTL